jgi:hypothetical protein
MCCKMSLRCLYAVQNVAECHEPALTLNSLPFGSARMAL